MNNQLTKENGHDHEDVFEIEYSGYHYWGIAYHNGEGETYGVSYILNGNKVSEMEQTWRSGV